MAQVNMYTDGACKNNPGAGGWSFILQSNGREISRSGAVRCTTNNRMELMAVIEAMKMIKTPCVIHGNSDSQYVVNGINNWIVGNGVKTFDNTKNGDLWCQIAELCKHHEVKFEWVRGHNGNRENELCDRLANEAIVKGIFTVDVVYEKERQMQERLV